MYSVELYVKVRRAVMVCWCRRAFDPGTSFTTCEKLVPNQSVNGTPKCCAFWFPPLRSGARYVQRYENFLLFSEN